MMMAERFHLGYKGPLTPTGSEPSSARRKRFLRQLFGLKAASSETITPYLRQLKNAAGAFHSGKFDPVF
jgi:hypothetical protein